MDLVDPPAASSFLTGRDRAQSPRCSSQPMSHHPAPASPEVLGSFCLTPSWLQECWEEKGKQFKATMRGMMEWFG